MTTTKNKRTLGDDPAIENTEGAPIDGFQDPTGEFPKREYHYGSSINRSARGLKVENLYLGGGSVGTGLDLEDQEPSRFPFNQTKETASGHIISYDDTPGGERILIKHRKGAGVEVRADGSVVISAVNNKVEVTGGDQTVIVEGNGKLVYNGNLNLEVTGDYNVNVGGDYNVNVDGNTNTSVRKNNTTTVGLNTNYTTKGTEVRKTVEHQSNIVLGNCYGTVKGHWKNNVGAEIEMFTGNRFHASAEKEFVMTALQGNISATEISVTGMKGVMGGEQVEMTSPVYMGPMGATPFTSGASFYGSFHGQATEAIRSYNANVADKAKTAFQAQKAGTAGVIGAAGSASDPTVAKATEGQESLTPLKPIPICDAVAGLLSDGHLSIRAISIDSQDKIRNKILLRDDYAGLFEKEPTIDEIRSTMRDEANRTITNEEGITFPDALIKNSLINPNWQNTTPPKIGRLAKKSTSPRFGYHALGNSVKNRGKRFK
jgi:hypothetical protein